MTQINAGNPFLGLLAVFGAFGTGASADVSVAATCCFANGKLVTDSFLLSTSTLNTIYKLLKDFF